MVNVLKQLWRTPLVYLSLMPLLLSVLYWYSTNGAKDDTLFPYFFLAVILSLAIAVRLELSYVLRFAVAVLVCGLFHRNVYLLSFVYYSPFVASVVAQVLNVGYSYSVNTLYTCSVEHNENRKFSSVQRTFLYGLLFMGEVALHYMVSIYLLRYFNPFLTWLLTGIVVVPYSLLGVGFVFAKKN